MAHQQINYSQCWEDPRVVLQALSISAEDAVLSITSGGDNTLAILQAQPLRVVSVDSNPLQSNLLELKVAALTELPRNDALELLGIVPSHRRSQLFSNLKGLSPEATAWWSGQAAVIATGVIHSGKLESYLRLFRRYALPLIHSRRVTERFLHASTLKEQRLLYHTAWNSSRWRFFFQLFTSRFLMQRFARQRGMFAYTEQQNVAQQYRQRLEQNFTSVPIADNYFMHYCLTGSYDTTLPFYLEESSVQRIRTTKHSLTLVTCDLFEYLQSVPDNTFSKYNLSDIFEALSLEECDRLWEQLVRTATPGARVVFWNNLVPRSHPNRFASSLREDQDSARSLKARDRVFFYGPLHIYTVTK